MTDPAGRPRWWDKVVDRSADVAVAAVPVPHHVLDVGCGTGELLRELMLRVPTGAFFFGVDPDLAALDEARSQSGRPIDFVCATSDALPLAADTMDLVVGSVAEWSANPAGIAEIARVLAPSGTAVLVDRTSVWHGASDVPHLLDAVGLVVERTEAVLRKGLGAPTVKAFVATVAAPA